MPALLATIPRAGGPGLAASDLRCHWSISFPTPKYGLSGDGDLGSLDREDVSETVGLRNGKTLGASGLNDVLLGLGVASASLIGRCCIGDVRGSPTGDVLGMPVGE